MNSLALIATLCTLMWYLIDNLKENIWGNLKYSNYITILASAVGSFVLSFGYELDLVCALDIVDNPTKLGYCLTAITMMGGSALVSEVIEMFRNKI